MTRSHTQLHRRAAAVIAMVIVLVVAGLVLLGFVLAGARDLDLMARQAEGTRAMYAAQAGINMSFRELIENSDDDDDGTIGAISDDSTIATDPTLGDARFFSTVSDLGGEYLVTSTGNAGQAWRTLRARITIGGTTFGITDEYTTDQDKVDDQQIATQVTLAEPGTVSSISAYIKGPPPKLLRYAIYANAGGEPGALLVESANTACTSNQFHWQAIPIPDTHLAAGTYWLALSFEHLAMHYAYIGVGGQTRYNNHDAVSLGYNTPWGVSSFTATRRIAIFASFTPDAGGGVQILGWDENP